MAAAPPCSDAKNASTIMSTGLNGVGVGGRGIYQTDNGYASTSTPTPSGGSQQLSEKPIFLVKNDGSCIYPTTLKWRS